MSAITTSLQAIPSAAYNVDPAHSNVGFEVRHMGIATVRVRFGRFQGTLDATGETPVLEGTVDVASIDTGEEQRDAHLTSPEFFDVQVHPEIRFRSTVNEVTEGGKLRPNGEITIKGITKPIELAGSPAEVARVRQAIAPADAIRFSTPEYNGTLPGQIKQAVDWGSRRRGDAASLWGKPVAVVGASVTDYGAIWAQEHLRKALGLAGARVLDVELPVAKADERFDADGVLVDLEIRDRLAEILGDLARQREQLKSAA